MFKPPEERGEGEYNSHPEQNALATVKNVNTLPAVTARLQHIDTDMRSIMAKLTELRALPQNPQVLGKIRGLTTIQVDLIQEETLLLAKKRELSKKGDATYLVKKDVWSESFEPSTRGAGTTKVEEFGTVKKGATLGKSGEHFNWKGTLGTDDRHA